MNIDGIKVGVTVTATTTAVAFIILTSFLSKYAVLWLSTEVILLPSIYIVGNILVEEIIRDKYNTALNEVINESMKLNEKYYNLKTKYNLLRRDSWQRRKKNQK